MLISMWKGLEAKDRRFVNLTVAGLFVIYAAYTLLVCLSLSDNRDRAARNHALRLSPNGVEQGHTPPDPLRESGDYVNVTVGTYVDSIDGFSIRDSVWSTNFYLWFKWKGPKDLDPGGRFVLVDGTVLKKDLLEETHNDDGTHYQKYRVSARFLKFFDTSRVPVESHMLNIYIEDGSRDGARLRYVADKSSNVSSRVAIPGYRVLGNANAVKAHTYRTTYGDPRLAPNERKTFTQYTVGIDITRANLGVYLKIFLSLFAALALALSNLFVKPSDVGPRFSLPSAAYFGAVANSYVANAILPPSGAFGLVDYVSGLGLFTIFITLALALLSNHIFVKRDNKNLSWVLDRAMFVVLTFCTIVANILIPWSAMG